MLSIAMYQGKTKFPPVEGGTHVREFCDGMSDKIVKNVKIFFSLILPSHNNGSTWVVSI